MDNPIVLCDLCQARPRRSAHANTKYCEGCKAARLRRPRSGVTPEQAAQLRELVGHMAYPEIQRRLGLSKAAITRFCWEEGIQHPFWNAYRPDVIAAVLAAYENAPRGAGKRRVQEQFPDVHVRSIVERYKHFKPRQIRWTAAQLLEAARMAGLVSRAAQARYFGRPHANDGSIHALWVKRFRCSPHDLNGLAAHTVYRLCGPGTPAVLVRHLQTIGPSSKVLWVTLRDHLKPSVDPLVRDVVEVLAQFQTWLHNGADREAIMTMIRERETYGDTYDASDHERPQRADPAAHYGARGGTVPC